MKGSTAKPISSPGRTDKFPPPLMRFLKTNVGSRSRGRSRASPMFMRKKNTNNAVIQEPSSPKVTCIGQVRVKRCSTTATAQGGKRRPENHDKRKQRPCWWKIRKTLFCNNIQLKLNRPKSCFSVLSKWVFCFCQKRVETVDSCSRIDLGTSTTASGTTVEAVTNPQIEGFGVTENENACTPPKNALFLTRCRSAPYRSSSLAGRFWGSPLNSSETDEKIEEKSVLEKPISPNGESVNLGSRNSHESEETQNFNGGNCKEEDEEKHGGSYVHPLLLTRCKSEPARTGARLIPDNSKT